MRRQTFEQLAALQKYEFVGDKTDKWHRVAQAQQSRFEKFVGRLPHSINVYFLTKTGGIGANAEVLTDPPYGIAPDPRAINIFIRGMNARHGVLPPTAWIILHRFSHVILDTGKYADYYRNCAGLVDSLLKTVYGIDVGTSRYVYDWSSPTLSKQLFTFRAARNEANEGQYEESIIDLFTQTIVKGKPDFLMPSEITLMTQLARRRPEKPKTVIKFPMIVDSGQAKQIVEQHRNQMAKIVRRFLNKMVGKYIVC